MFYRIMYLIVTLVFSHLGFWSGNLFLIASFPDLCLLVPFSFKSRDNINEKVDGSYRGFGYSSLISDSINLATWNQRQLLQFYEF